MMMVYALIYRERRGVYGSTNYAGAINYIFSNDKIQRGFF